MMLPVVAAAAACTPTLLLDTSSPDSFTFRPSCGSLAASPHAVFARTSLSNANDVGSFVNSAISPDGAITIPRSTSQQSITIAATDSSGKPLLQDFTLHDLDSRSQPQASPQIQWPKNVASSPSPSSGSCTACSSTMCKPECQHPTNQCTFYATCAEATWSCGPDGYPLAYGLKNCNKFMDRLSHFSANGQAWIMRVLTCLQDFLVAPLSSCNTTCTLIYNEAFDSHPQCYLQAGVCSLSLADMVQLVITVNTDLFAGPALKQALTVAGGCISQYIDLIKQEISNLERGDRGGSGNGSGAETLGKITLLEGAQKILESWS